MPGEAISASAERHIPTPAKAALAVWLAFGLAGCLSTAEDAPRPASAAATPADPRTQTLVGRWGTASYREEKDRRRTEAQARAQCRLPYVIARGPTDGVMMHAADDPKLYELKLKAAPGGKLYLGFEAPPGDWQDREILSFSEDLIVMRFVDPEINARYGTFVYVRCPG